MSGVNPARLWTIYRSKNNGKKTLYGGADYRVSDRAVDVLNRTGTMAGSSNTNERAGWIFPARKREKSISNMAMLMLLRRLERTDITVHGFRSTFRDWAAEKTDFPREIIEGALAHSLGNQVELAYFRSDILEKRRLLMEAWGAYCCK